nr:unnamed protein product [Callosobruchus analis]
MQACAGFALLRSASRRSQILISKADNALIIIHGS